MAASKKSDHLEIEFIKDQCALAYVTERKVGAKTAIAKLSFRLLTGLTPFPTQLKNLQEQLQDRGDKLNEEITEKIAEMIERSN